VRAALLIAALLYTVRVHGGAIDPRVKDLAGNALAADDTWTFTTGSAGCPCSVWDPASTRPAIADTGDGSAVELGVKIPQRCQWIHHRPAVLQERGEHWAARRQSLASDGTLLGSATFTSETASGWREVSFSTPIAITVNTVYVASYYSERSLLGDTELLHDCGRRHAAAARAAERDERQRRLPPRIERIPIRELHRHELLGGRRVHHALTRRGSARMVLQCIIASRSFSRLSGAAAASPPHKRHRSTSTTCAGGPQQAPPSIISRFLRPPMR
jgi:hypothetical protein